MTQVLLFPSSVKKMSWVHVPFPWSQGIFCASFWFGYIILFLFSFDLSVSFRTIYSLGSPGGPCMGSSLMGPKQIAKNSTVQASYLWTVTTSNISALSSFLRVISVLQRFSCSNRNSLAKVEFSCSVFWRQRQPVWSVSSWSWWLYPSCQTGSPIWTGDMWCLQ